MPFYSNVTFDEFECYLMMLTNQITMKSESEVDPACWYESTISARKFIIGCRMYDDLKILVVSIDTIRFNLLKRIER